MNTNGQPSDRALLKLTMAMLDRSISDELIDLLGESFTANPFVTAIADGRVPHDSTMPDGTTMFFVSVCSLDDRRVLGWYRRDRDDIFRSGNWWGDREWVQSARTILTERPPVEVGPARFYRFGDIDGTVLVEHIAAAIIATVAGQADVMGLLTELPLRSIGLPNEDDAPPEVARRMPVRGDPLTTLIRDHVGEDRWLSRDEIDVICSAAMYDWTHTAGAECPFLPAHTRDAITRVAGPAGRYYSHTAVRIIREAIASWPGCPKLCIHADW
ncbi:hypothetical protein ABLE94_24450 [Gordonia sp. VNK1]|uniref:hypothetical protein n=1 Tax=Gordonia oleivorans TaxID=3156618 RepID=UPI0032B5ECD4